MSTMDSIEEEYREEIDRLRAENAALKEANERMSKSCADSDRHIERVEAKLADLKAEMKHDFEVSTSIIHDEGARRIIAEENVVTLNNEVLRLSAKLADLHRGLETMMEIFEAGRVNE